MLIAKIQIHASLIQLTIQILINLIMLLIVKDQRIASYTLNMLPILNFLVNPRLHFVMLT